MGKKLYLAIPKTRAEYPHLAVAIFFTFILWAIHYGFFGWQGGLIALLILLPLLAFWYFKKRGDYFVQADDNGISWRKDILSRYNFIPWKYMQRVDYLVFEINFKVKETGQVVSFPTSGLTEEETDQLKQFISDLVNEKMQSGEL